MTEEALPEKSDSIDIYFARVQSDSLHQYLKRVFGDDFRVSSFSVEIKEKTSPVEQEDEEELFSRAQDATKEDSPTDLQPVDLDYKSCVEKLNQILLSAETNARHLVDQRKPDSLPDGKSIEIDELEFKLTQDSENE